MEQPPTTSDSIKKKLYDAIRAIPDFPKPGVIFRDITTLLLQPELLEQAIELMIEPIKNASIQKIVAVESRGFIFAPLMATRLNVGLVLARKPGKLPAASIEASYILEYGNNTLQMHQDAIQPNDNVLVVDDVLATGGTACAVAELVSQLKGRLHGYCFLIELANLNGRKKIASNHIHSVLSYD